jgi:hypothetical protein
MAVHTLTTSDPQAFFEIAWVVLDASPEAYRLTKRLILLYRCRLEGKRDTIDQVRYWEIIADNLSKAGWSWGCVSAIDSNGRNDLDCRRASADGGAQRDVLRMLS